MIRIGVDVVDIKRIEDLMNKYGEKFLERVLTEKEKEYVMSKSKWQRNLHIAGRFASKEAFYKAIGTGIIAFKEVEVVNDNKGKPVINVYGKAKEVLESMNPKYIDISISHTNTVAVAVVVIEI